jgi:hypothetical protein
MRGGIYTFYCPKCQASERRFVWDVDADKQTCECGAPLRRSVPPSKQGFTPILCEALGVHPSQVAEHRRVHPDIPMTDDGRVVIRSYRENVRICKKLGFDPK